MDIYIQINKHLKNTFLDKRYQNDKYFTSVQGDMFKGKTKLGKHYNLYKTFDQALNNPNQ